MKNKEDTMIKANIPLADNIDLETYDVTPIDSFGLNILMKYSNKDSSSNLNNKRKAPSNIIEYKPRNHRLGLGCDITNDIDNKHKNNNNTQSHNYYGTKVIIIGGQHKGLKAKIVDAIKCDDLTQYLKHNKYITIQLKHSKETIKIKSKYITLRSRHHDQQFNKTDEDNDIPTSSKEPLSWIQQGLIVRIVNKASKYYNTKVRVEDIIDDSTFSVIANDNVLHSDIKESECETVIPHINEDVVILNKETKGQLGKLIEKHKTENKAFVQLYDDLSIIELTLDDLCSFKK